MWLCGGLSCFHLRGSAYDVLTEISQSCYDHGISIVYELGPLMGVDLMIRETWVFWVTSVALELHPAVPTTYLGCYDNV